MHYCEMKGDGCIRACPRYCEGAGGRGGRGGGGCRKRKSGNGCERVWIGWLLWMWMWLGLWWSETAEEEHLQTDKTIAKMPDARCGWGCRGSEDEGSQQAGEVPALAGEARTLVDLINSPCVLLLPWPGLDYSSLQSHRGSSTVHTETWPTSVLCACYAVPCRAAEGARRVR